MSWNKWALQLCEAEDGTPQLRSKCLLQRTVLLLQQQQHLKALESASEVLAIVPESKHAAALLATAQHKAGNKKGAAVTVTDLLVSFQRADDSTMTEELGCFPAQALGHPPPYTHPALQPPPPTTTSHPAHHTRAVRV